MKRLAFITLFWLCIFGLFFYLLLTNEWIQCRIFGEQTAYTERFDEKAFLAITKGQTENQVRSQLGEPLRIAEFDGESFWIYSQSPPNSTVPNFKVRIVTFGSNRVVKKKEAGLYID